MMSAKHFFYPPPLSKFGKLKISKIKVFFIPLLPIGVDVIIEWCHRMHSLPETQTDFQLSDAMYAFPEERLNSESLCSLFLVTKIEIWENPHRNRQSFNANCFDSKELERHR